MIMGTKFTINNFSLVVPIFNEEEILLVRVINFLKFAKNEIDFEIIFSKMVLLIKLYHINDFSIKT